METKPHSGAFASDWVLMLAVPLVLMQPTVLALVAGPAFTRQQWDRQEGLWSVALLAGMTVSYAAWVCRWTVAGHVAPLIRLFAVLLLVPGFLTSVNFLRSAVVRLGSIPSGPEHGTSGDGRVVVLAVATAVTTAAVVAFAHDRRRRTPSGDSRH